MPARQRTAFMDISERGSFKSPLIPGLVGAHANDLDSFNMLFREGCPSCSIHDTL